MARRKRAHKAFTFDHLLRLLHRVESNLRPSFARTLAEKTAGIFIDAELSVALLHHQVGVRRFEVEIIQRALFAHHLLFNQATRNHQVLRVIDQRLLEAHGILLQPRTGLVNVGIVTQHQHVQAVTVFEVVENALVLHQPRDEIESRFVVLHAIFPFVVGTFQIVAKIAEAEIRKHRLDDFGHGLILKDATVGGLRQQPQPRMNLCVITREPRVRFFLDETANDPIEVMLRVVREIQRDGN